jgi:prepilin-type N-terminal cleavage/methylation domain-containing protein
MRRSSAAFTLLEVMAAVAVVAIVFSTLARVASEGLRSQGISKRRLEASLLVDAQLAEIEVQFASGIAPEIGESESEEDPFSISVSVTSFDIESAIPASGFGDTDPATQATLAGVLGDEVSPVRAIEISVTWLEGLDEYSVIRNTFGIDPVALAALAGAAPEIPTLPGNLPSLPGNLPSR